MDIGDEGSASDFAVPAGRIRKRRFSSARIQPTRIKKVMQSDEEIGRMVHSVPVALGSAMEHFAEKLLECAAQSVQFSSARTLTPSHIRFAIMKNRHFAFLDDLTKEIPMLRINAESDGFPEVAVSSGASQYNPVPTLQRRDNLGALPLNSLPVSSQSNSDLNPTSLISQKSCTPKQPSYQQQQPSTAASGDEQQPVKRKRGRPRKDKSDRFLDSSENSVTSPLTPISPAKTDLDKVLMPPPSIPSGRSRRTFLRPGSTEATGSSPPSNPTTLTAV
ncbi:unnamed protein product [Bursaphelenchus okinawaensis]|uniref:Transcription factor CBF/NF-Y/archaeal histone domain-containing protein n=1 Tax=Bursaphelenchus okinawaensis TaxID=465554 RepID=A0A811LBI7_9BILA|nr:unnamed protein product [Bursaphelenchus okinawaensis]CAG9120297.1 unnamed protein product [Bursaphelenchus okinawaensis]